MVHGKAKLTPAGRLLLVQRIEGEHCPVAHAAAMVGVSRCTAYKWLRRWRDEGLAGLEDRSSRPRSCPRRTSIATEAQILELRQELRRGPHLLGGRLGIAPSTVLAVLRRHGMSRLSRLERVSGIPIRYERSRPGELIHIDVKKLGRVPDGGGWKVRGREFQAKVAKAEKHASDGVLGRDSVMELEQAGDSAKAAAEADAGLSSDARDSRCSPLRGSGVPPQSAHG